MPVYILTIPGSEFTGVLAGVDFFKGKGSTSSLADAHALTQTKNCGIAVVERDGTEKPIAVKKIVKEHLADSYVAAPIEPVPEQAITAGGVEASAPSVPLSPDAAAFKAAEDNPDSPGQKRLAEAGRARKARETKRQRRPR